MNPSLHIFTVSWLLNQNIFSSRYHLLYQLSLWHRWFKFLTEGHTGHWWQRAAWSSPSPGVLQESAWTGTYLRSKAFSKDLFTLQSKWNSFQNSPNETGLSELVPRIFHILRYSFFFLFTFLGNYLSHMLSLSLPSPTYFLFLLFFSVYLEDFSFEKHIFSSVRDGWRSGKLGLAICPVSEDSCAPSLSHGDDLLPPSPSFSVRFGGCYCT